jgi:hypothetical protein
MMYRTIMLTIAALSTTQASAGDLAAPVYVAPGGVYIGSAQVFVTPGPKYAEPYAAPYAAPTYDPGYVAPGYLRRPAYYGAPAYVAPPYALPPYAVDYAPRPPVAVPYGYNGHNGYGYNGHNGYGYNGHNGYGHNGYNGRCYVDPAYGRYCN